MSTPVAIPSDLALFIGATVDDSRADLILGLAQDACEEFVTPLPDSAKRIVLAVAARIYTNPTSVPTEAVGPYSAGRPAIDLTRRERHSLRRLAGRGGGAGSTSALVSGANAVQAVTVSATAGTYTLTLDGVTTAAIAFNATASAVQDALAALPNVGVGNVSVSGAYVVTFVNSLGNSPVPSLVADASSLTGTVVVAATVQGAAAPGANLPGWEYDYSASSPWRLG